MSDKKNLMGQNLQVKSLWKRIGIHKQRTNSQSQIKVRSQRSGQAFDRKNSNYSQVRNDQEHEIPQEIPQGPDSYEVPQADHQDIINDDPAFRNMLEILKINSDNQCEFRARLTTFGPDDFAEQHKLAVSGEKTPKNKKQLAEETIRQQIIDMRRFIESFRENYQKEQVQFAHFFRQLINLCNPPQKSPMPVAHTEENSMCQSVQLQSYEVVKDLSVNEMQKGKIQQLALDDCKQILKENNRQLDEKRKAVQQLELKCTEIDARHKMTILRLENQNKLLNLEMAEVMRRFETERKTLRIQTDDKQTDRQKSDYQEIKESLKIKEAQVGSLRSELNKQYETMQVLIRNMYELEESNKDSNNPSMFLEKDMEIEKLTAKLAEVQSQLERVEKEAKVIKGQSYAIYEQNFCLLQKIQSFESEFTEKMKLMRKELSKDFKSKLSVLQMQNKKLMAQLNQANQKLFRKTEDFLLIKRYDEKSVSNQRNMRMRYNTCEHDTHSGVSEGSNQMSTPNENFVRLPDRPTVSKNPNRNYQGKLSLHDSGGYNDDEDLGQPISPPNDRILHSRPAQHHRADSRQPDRSSNHDRHYQQSPPYDTRRAMDDYSNSFYLHGQGQSRNSQTRPQFATSNIDYHRREKNLYETMRVVANHASFNGDAEVAKRKPSQNHYETRGDVRSRSRDAKLAEFTSLEVQLNKLTKELRSQIALIPSRKAK